MELLTYLSEFGRDRGNLPDLPIINLFAETAEPNGNVTLQSRPGVEISSTLGTDPIRFLYSEPGVFTQDLFAVMGTSLYRGASLLGTVTGSGPVSMDSFAGTTFYAAGENIHKYDGATLSTVTFPDGAPCSKVVVGASRLVAIQKESQTIYWTLPLETSIDALDFAQAEYSPDRLLDMLFIGDMLILFGEATVEFWTSQTGSGDIPFAPVPGRMFPKGIKNTGAAVPLGSSWAWITNTNQICVTNPDNVISTREIETEIEEAGSASLWTFYLDSIEFLAVRVGDKTHVFNTTNPTWTQFQTYGSENWEAQCFSNGYFGSAVTGDILAWSDNYIDATVLERRFRVWAPINMETVIANSIFLRVNPGRTSYTVGEYISPNIEMRLSRDGGNTWTSWRTTQMGYRGDYRKQTKFLSCGIFSYPGALAEFRITDPVPFRASSVSVNGPYGGY